MRTLVFLFFWVFSVAVHAGCNQIASITTETLSIDIGTGGCSTEQDIIWFATKKPGEKEFSKEKQVPFLSECTRTKDGFKCNPKGKTPLAGATYKSVKFGPSQNSCADEAELGERYICIKGCSKPNVPIYLDGFDGTC